MRGALVLLAALLLWLAAGPGAAQAVEGPDYADWQRTAERAEALSEGRRGSAFALNRLRAEIVAWRETFAAAQAANAARLATVESQLAALGPAPGEGSPPEDEAIAARRAALLADLARLRAPGLLAQEAHAHASGLIGEIDALLRSRSTAALLTRSAPPLDPRNWPAFGEALAARGTGLWKEVTTSFASPARHAVFARDWPAALLLGGVAALLLGRGRRWAAQVEARLGPGRPQGWLRGQHGAAIARLAVTTARALLPLLGLVALAAALRTTGLFGSRALALVSAIPLAGACVLAADWLAAQFFARDRDNPAPFDFAPEMKDPAARHLVRGGWALAAGILARAFLATGEIAPEVASALLLPFDVALALLLARLGQCLASRHVLAEGAAPDGDLILFRRRLVVLAGRVAMAVAAAAPVLSILGFHRAGAALLLPSVLTLALVGVAIVLQWFVADLYALLTRRDDGLRDALLPVLAGFALALAALPVLALIWGARPEDLQEIWARARAGFTVGQTRLSPGAIATFALVFAAGWWITRFVQGMLRSTVLPKTRLDTGARNALVAGLGYLGIILSALLAVSVAGLDLSNLAIVAGALSVGIGFGLQNIVQNFVAGIILLIERPISEGDWIEVGGRMGYVRQISVRSTRIETFDRTDVIVPNAELVSGQVVNWTRGNLVGRLILPVSVSYGSDPEQVTRILREVAEAHPMVLLSPPPAVVLAGFGPDALNFEIRAIIRDVNFGTTTRSEINGQIARRFHAEGIRTAGTPAPPPPPPRTLAA
jgi:potassium efflux system protein